MTVATEATLFWNIVTFPMWALGPSGSSEWALGVKANDVLRGELFPEVVNVEKVGPQK